jgi:tetratricopeptide (TPR) repeat protein
MTAWLALLAAGALAPTATLATQPASSAQVEDALAAAVAELDAPDSARVRAAWDSLAAAGDVAADACVAGFDTSPLAARRLRAQLLVLNGAARHIAPACAALLGDPDPAVRASLCSFLGRLDLSAEELEPRTASLARAAREDAADEVRKTAIGALADLESAAALESVGEIARTAGAPDRVWAAEALPEGSRAWSIVQELVQSGFRARSDGSRTADDVLAAVLPLYGRLLADQPGTSEGTRFCAPMVLALRHPASEVREAGRTAWERLLGRLRELGEAERALRLLANLAEQGVDERLVEYHRARLAFYPGAAPDDAAAAARALHVVHASEDPEESRMWLFRALHLEGMAELGAGRAAEADRLLARAEAVLDGVLALRRDLQDEESRRAHLDALLARAVVGVSRLVTGRLVEPPVDRAELIERARAVHESVLEAQLSFARAGLDVHASLDGILDAELSPFRLLFTGLALPGIDGKTELDLENEVGRLLASVAPTELPGFEPYDAPLDPLADPRRKDLLVQILFARFDEYSRQIGRRQERLLRGQQSIPGCLPDPADLFELQILRYRRQELRGALDDLDGAGAKQLRELRVPCSLALWLARDLRNEGRTVEARRLATSMREDLEEEGTHHAFFWGLELSAEIEIAIGSSWTDEGEPQRAEEELLAAVARLEEIEQRLVENGAGPRQIENVRNLRSTALVSLAVNANVKLGDPERALAYYERAYVLRQDEFMRVLLACYRARSGRAAEARALLREVKPGPQVYYNLACTHALLGERDPALDYLEKELRENHLSPGSLERQKEWARGDPDLAALRDDPRFVALTRAE